MVFQVSGLAFAPVYTIGQQMTEMIRAYEPVSQAVANARALHIWTACKSRRPSAAWPRTRMSCRAACASAP